MSYKIPGLVAESISQELFDRINDVTSPNIIKNTITLYVGNNGNDETNDGTQKKPFRTIAKCIEYVRTKLYLSSLYTNNVIYVYIKFTTDYEQDRLVIANDNNHYYIDGTGFNVNIKNYIRSSYSNFTIRNITVDCDNNNIDTVFTSLGKGYLITENCIININKPTTALNSIFSNRYTSYLSLNKITINGNNNAINLQNIINTYQNSHTYLSNNITVINCSLSKHKNGVIGIFDNGYVYIATSTNFLGENITGKKYYIDGNGTIETNGRGESIFTLGTEDGVIENGWLI